MMSVLISGFYTFLSLASSLLTFHLSRSCLTNSLHIFLGCSLTKLPPTSNFQYILDQKISSISPQISPFFSIFKMFKKQAHWNKEKWNLGSFFTDSENDKIGEIDGNYLGPSFTFKLPMVQELVQKLMHKYNEMFYL